MVNVDIIDADTRKKVGTKLINLLHLAQISTFICDLLAQGTITELYVPGGMVTLTEQNRTEQNRNHYLLTLEET